MPVIHSQLNDLKGHTAAHGFLLFGHIDDPASPFADLLQQLVGADTVPGVFGGAEANCEGGLGRGCSQIIGSALFGLEQRPNSFEQFNVTCAGLLQICFPLLRRQLQGGFKYRHLALMRIGHGLNGSLFTPYSEFSEEKVSLKFCGASW
jgi:hypothetical protein